MQKADTSLLALTCSNTMVVAHYALERRLFSGSQEFEVHPTQYPEGLQSQRAVRLLI